MYTTQVKLGDMSKKMVNRLEHVVMMGENIGDNSAKLKVQFHILAGIFLLKICIQPDTSRVLDL